MTLATVLAANGGDWGLTIVALLALGMLVLFVLIFLSSRYKRCPSDKILVVYGKVGAGQSARCVHGGAALVWAADPGLQLHEPDPHHHQHPAQERALAPEHRVDVPSTFTVGVSTERRSCTTPRCACCSCASTRSRHGPGDHLRPAALTVASLDHRADQPGRESFLAPSARTSSRSSTRSACTSST